jgi:molybdopterin-guanine dinucleotide biosynthesis protein A
MGTEKGLLPIGGNPLITLVAGRLDELFRDVFLAGGGEDVYGFTGLRVVPDRIPGMGPLMGIASALEDARFETVFVAACDMPMVDPALVDRLMSAAADGFDCAVPRVGEGLFEPLFAVYRRSALPVINEVLASGGRKVRSVFPRLRVCSVDMPLPGGILNLNTPEDVRRFERELK